MKLQRNDPCHCGSGKKYKHCHMAADLENERARKAVAPLLPTRPLAADKQYTVVEEPKVIDPAVERLNQLYEQFQNADYVEKKAILRTTMTEKALDDELAFEWFNDLYSQMVEQGEREEFAELATLLRENQPEVYAKENHWFWSWEIANALALHNEEALQQAVDQLIANGGQDLDQFYPVFNCLLYHDRRETVRNALAEHRPHIVPGKYFDGVEVEMNQKFVDLLVFDYIETHAQSDLLKEDNFELLCSTLGAYTDTLLQDELAEFIAWASGLKSQQWSLADFQFAVRPRRQGWFDDDDDDDNKLKNKVDPAIVRLRDLSSEFLYYARQTANIALTKADLARGNLVTYILERLQGELVEEKTEKRPKVRPHVAKGRAKASEDKPHILLPDHKTVDRYLMRFYGFMANGTYEGAAFFELLPTWVHFLQSKGLANEEEGFRALRSLQELSQAMRTLMEQHDSDPTLAENMGRWRTNAGI